MDFACTLGLRADKVRVAAVDPVKVTEAYEVLKDDFTAPGATGATGEQCRQRGFQFIPVMLEAHGGGLGKTARCTVDTIARAGAAASNEDPAAISLRIAQRISMTLHRENARAILRQGHMVEPLSVAEFVPIDGPIE